MGKIYKKMSKFMPRNSSGECNGMVGSTQRNQDKRLAAQEPICDMCGTVTKNLRHHQGGKICWYCKADLMDK